MDGATDCPGASKEYNIPDYCSRAMIQELSMVYDNVNHRTMSTAAAVGAAHTSSEPDCSGSGWFYFR